MIVFFPYCDVYTNETASRTGTNVGGAWFCTELIGWLWFAIGGSDVSDRLPRPHHQ